MFDHFTTDGSIVSVHSAIVSSAKLSMFSFLVGYFLEVNF